MCEKRVEAVEERERMKELAIIKYKKKSLACAPKKRINNTTKPRREKR